MTTEEKTIETTKKLRLVADAVTFAPSCLDMGWEWKIFEVDDRMFSGWLVSTTFRRPDRETGKIGAGIGRSWWIDRGTTESGVVKTLFSAAKMIIEHELLEAFHYKGVRLFDPHRTVSELSLPDVMRFR